MEPERHSRATREYAAVVLAGGAARRLGGVDKPALDVGGVSMLHRVLAAVAGARSTLVLGREYGPGPVAALAGALDRFDHGATYTVIVAGDLPFLDIAAIDELLLAVDSGGDAAVLVDDTGRRQWLAAAWRTDILVTRLSTLDSQRMADLYDGLNVQEVVAVAAIPGAEPWRDVDSAAELAAARLIAEAHRSDGVDGSPGE